MISIFLAGMLSGSAYWNDQLSFGVALPQGYAHCTGTEGTPDRGVYVFLDKKITCPNLAETSLYEFAEKEKIPTISVVASYNVTEEFGNSMEFAKAYCASNSSFFRRTINGQEMSFCVEQRNGRKILKGFAQLHKEPEKGSGVNVEFALNDAAKYRYKSQYWRLLRSLVLTSGAAKS